MNKTSTIVITSIIVSLLTIIGIIYFGIPLLHPVSEGDITKIVKQQMVQEKINETSRVTNLESDVTNALDKVLPSVVTINEITPLPTTTRWTPQNILKKWGASGIIITKDWYILTNKHVIPNEDGIYEVTTIDWSTYKVDAIRRDPVMDMAVLHILDWSGAVPSDIVSASFVSYKSTIRVGQFVLSLGNIEWQNETSATLWIISAVKRTLPNPPTSDLYVWLYQTDAALHEWNSWWPLINTIGDVIWVTTAKATLESEIGYAIPLTSEFITATIASIGSVTGAATTTGATGGVVTGSSTTGGVVTTQPQNNMIPRPYFGAELLVLSKKKAIQNDYSKFEWYYIDSIESWSPAEIAGLLVGDIITDIWGNAVNNSLPFIYILHTYKPGDTISLRVFRNKEYKNIEVKTTQLIQNY